MIAVCLFVCLRLHADERFPSRMPQWELTTSVLTRNVPVAHSPTLPMPPPAPLALTGQLGPPRLAAAVAPRLRLEHGLDAVAVEGGVVVLGGRGAEGRATERVINCGFGEWRMGDRPGMGYAR